MARRRGKRSRWCCSIVSQGTAISIGFQPAMDDDGAILVTAIELEGHNGWLSMVMTQINMFSSGGARVSISS